MVCEAHLDADGEVVARLRSALGPDFPIVLTLDRVQAINLRTAPVEVSAKAARLRVSAVVEAPEQSRA